MAQTAPDASSAALQRRVSGLDDALTASRLVGQAVGLIIARYGFTEAQAVGVLRRLSHDDPGQLAAMSDGICRAHAARIAAGRPTVLTD